MTLQDQIKKTIEKHQMITQGDDLLVAVSGGPDSVALLHLLVTCARSWSCASKSRIAARDSRRRGSEDARFVAELAAKLGLPFHLKSELRQIKSAAGKGNLEALAGGAVSFLQP